VEVQKNPYRSEVFVLNLNYSSDARRLKIVFQQGQTSG